MGVDGGAGNAISLSEIQSFYGGSNPISLSEYYRAASGTEVPTTRTDSTSNTGVSGNMDNSEVRPDGSFSGNQSSFSVTNANNTSSSISSSITINFQNSGTVTAAVTSIFNGFPITVSNSKITLNGQDIIDGSNRVTLNSAQSVTLGSSMVGGKFISGAATGVGGEEGDGTIVAGSLFKITRGGTTIHQNPNINVQNNFGSDTLDISSNPIQNGDVLVVPVNVGTSRSVVLYGPEASQVNSSISVSAGNNTLTHVCGGGNDFSPGYNFGLTYHGGAGTVTYSNATGGYQEEVFTDTSSTVNTNTNVPTSGAINMDVFNAPGTASA